MSLGLNTPQGKKLFGVANAQTPQVLYSLVAAVVAFAGAVAGPAVVVAAVAAVAEAAVVAAVVVVAGAIAGPIVVVLAVVAIAEAAVVVTM